MAILKNPEDIVAMKKACVTAAEILDYLTPFVKVGTTTGELDRLCKERIKELGIKSATVGYAPPGMPPFPSSICTSLNHVICHGIPSNEKVLKNGDIMNIDVTIIQDGWYGDTSRMYYIGEPSILAKRLVDVTYECMWRGIRAVKPGATLGDIGHTIQQYAEAQGFSVVREYCGHGVGRNFHEEPQVLHYGKPGQGQVLKEGMVFTIEPMINTGRPGCRVLADEWTVVTKDHSLSAQWEHTIIVTADGAEVLTVSAGSPPPTSI